MKLLVVHLFGRDTSSYEGILGSGESDNKNEGSIRSMAVLE